MRAYVIYEVQADGRQVPFGFARASGGREAVRRVRRRRSRREHGWLIAREASDVPPVEVLRAWARGALHLVIDDQLDDPPRS